MSASELAHQNGVCQEEKTAYSRKPGGSGPVADDEELARVILSADITNGKLQSSFMPLDHLRDGWSFNRLYYAGEDKVIEHGKRLASRQGVIGELCGYAVIQAGNFRALRDRQNRQAFCILDDETDDAPSHAIAKIRQTSAKMNCGGYAKKYWILYALCQTTANSFTSLQCYIT